MKVSVHKNPYIYSCHMYMVRGSWNAIVDVNTLIDPGTDKFILDDIADLSTGVGKRKIEQVILTHEHFDHSGGLKWVIEEYNPKVYAFSKIKGVTHQLHDGMHLRVGDRDAMIIHSPGHSHDSILIYIEEDGALFSGDTPLTIKSPGGTYIRPYVDVLERLARLEINAIYPGHDDPITTGAKSFINRTLENVRASKIID